MPFFIRNKGLATATGCVIILLTYTAWPKTRVCGYIKKATDWTRKHSPYIVENDIFIPKNSRLNIEAGVTLLFSEPKPCKDESVQYDWNDSIFSGIKVDGIFYAKGTEQHPIVFKPISPVKGKIGWDGIRVENRTPAVISIEFCHFLNAHVALQVEQSNFSIRQSIFESCNTGIKLYHFSNVHIINNTFFSNKSCGIYIEGSNPIVLNNNFAKNLGYGIWSDSRDQINIQYNNFWNNGDGHCFRCPVGILRMTRVKKSGDSTDNWNNMSADPIFLNSDSYKKSQNRDIDVDTDTTKVKNKKMAMLEKIYRTIRRGEKIVVDHSLNLGKGPFSLSKYSPLIHAGHPDAQFNNHDGTPNDIGTYGGPFKELED